MSSYQKQIESFMKKLQIKDGHEPEFIQAVEEVAETVIPFIESNEKYKKTKNDLFLDSINFFLEIKYKIDSKKNYKFINLVTFKNGFIKLLYDYKKFNLTNNTILEFIKKSENLYA